MTGYQSKKAAAQDKLAQPEQEPVAWHHDLEFSRIQRVGWKPLYATPPQRTWVGLTAEEVKEMFKQMYDASANWPTFAAAIEAKLKERNA